MIVNLFSMAPLFRHGIIGIWIFLIKSRSRSTDPNLMHISTKRSMLKAFRVFLLVRRSSCFSGQGKPFLPFPFAIINLFSNGMWIVHVVTRFSARIIVGALLVRIVVFYHIGGGKAEVVSRMDPAFWDSCGLPEQMMKSVLSQSS